MTMYIFTPLNPYLFKKVLGDNGGAIESVNEEPEAHGHGHAGVRTTSRTVLLQKRNDLVNKKNDVKFKTIFKRLDEFILKPILIRNYEEIVVRLM